MRSNKKADTKPEVALRSALHGRGLRFRKHLRIDAGPVRVRPDLVFTRQRLAVFIDGCFWHGCPIHGNTPAVNRQYWVPKLARNRRRDAEVNEALTAAEWRVLRIWEHDDLTSAAERVVAALRREGGAE